MLEFFVITKTHVLQQHFGVCSDDSIELNTSLILF